LAGWLEQRMFARRASVRVLTGVTLFGRMLVLVCLANWCYAMPYPFQLPVWLCIGFGMLCIIGWYFTDFQLLRKLQTRA
jgi:multidrug transporter EmrE-like cation transporter